MRRFQRVEKVRATAKSKSWHPVPAEHDLGVWKNDVYTVYARTIPSPEGLPPFAWLSIKRNDRQPIHDWRDLQSIKNQIVGPDVEAVELYPAADRTVDQANQYHLWVALDPEFRWFFGMDEGRIIGDEQDPDVGLHGQRKWRKDHRETI